MSVPYEGSLTQRLISACTVPGGLSQHEVREATSGKPATIAALIGVLVREGRLFKAGVRCQYRYFASEAVRDAYEAAHAAEFGAVLELRSLSQAERDRIKYRRQSERRKAQRASEGKARPKLDPEERRRRKAESARVSYERKRKKLGLTVKHRSERAVAPAPKKEGRRRGPDIVIAPSKFKPPQQLATAKPASEPIITSNTKVTICPSGRDTRFEVDPSIAGRGVISADWMDARLKRVQGKGETA